MQPLQTVTAGTAGSKVAFATSQAAKPDWELDQSPTSGVGIANGLNFAAGSTNHTPFLLSHSEHSAEQSSIHGIGVEVLQRPLEFALGIDHPLEAVAATSANSQTASADSREDDFQWGQAAASSITEVQPDSVVPNVISLVAQHNVQARDESSKVSMPVRSATGQALASDLVGDNVQPSPDPALGSSNIQIGFVISHNVRPVEEFNDTNPDGIRVHGSFLEDEAHEVARTSSDRAEESRLPVKTERADTAISAVRLDEGEEVVVHKSRVVVVMSSVVTAFRRKQIELDQAGISSVGTLVVGLGCALVGCLIFFSAAVFVGEEEPKEFDRSGASGRDARSSRFQAAAKQQRDTLEPASAQLFKETQAPGPYRQGTTSSVPAPSSGAPPKSTGLAAPPPTLRRSCLATPLTASSPNDGPVLTAMAPLAASAVVPGAPVTATVPAVSTAPSRPSQGPPPPLPRNPLLAPGPEASRTEEQLCPSLVVPAGMEFIFAVRQAMTKERQMTAFSVVDMRGQPLSHIIANERSGAQCGIFLQALNKTPLASVQTRLMHERPGSLPDICRPSGEVFCSLVCDGIPSCGRYILRHKNGHRLLAFHGDFREKATNVVNASGRLVCATERCQTDFDGEPHYQVRVAPNVDAGLVLCGLLAIDKSEGSTIAASAHPTFTDIA